MQEKTKTEVITYKMEGDESTILKEYSKSLLEEEDKQEELLEKDAKKERLI